MKIWLILGIVWLTWLGAAAPTNSVPPPASAPPIKVVPPSPVREFRAVWIASVGNSCWPSKPGLTTAQQKAELLAILDRAQALKLNAVIFQIRPACDALYESKLEPWSEYLTGVQGRAPAPYYDPLAYAIQEAHKRGLELHAWFNPFRAHFAPAVSPIAGTHISKTHPEYVRSYDKLLWLDPGDPAVHDYTLRVTLDVLKRYDVDGIHFDDYFYPYPVTNKWGNIPFPDNPTWARYGQSSGLSRDDWRRRNVDQFINQIYHNIKAEKPWVKFGISPFGIWRPGYPATIKGMDPYTNLYADSLKWLNQGWCDYFAPQLYWAIQPPKTSFSTLLDWWNVQNVRHRNVWVGINSLNVGPNWQPEEILNQIALTRHYPNPGHIHWSAMALMRNGALDNALLAQCYNQPALIPASPWLNPTSPPPPKLSVSVWKSYYHLSWTSNGKEPVNNWVLQWREKGAWNTQILPANRPVADINHVNPDAISLRAVSRTGMLSEPAVWQPGK